MSACTVLRVLTAHDKYRACRLSSSLCRYRIVEDRTQAALKGPQAKHMEVLRMSLRGLGSPGLQVKDRGGWLPSP